MISDVKRPDLRSSITSIISDSFYKEVIDPSKNDPEFQYLREPAPNILEFVSGKQYLNIPSVYHFTRQYQVLRDFFQFRCPICNSLDETAIDCWGKTKSELEDEVLLSWSNTHEEDVCSSCNTTRTEFEEDGLLKKYNQLHGIVGMRSGKTATAGMIGAWMEHKLCVIAMRQRDFKLANYFGLLPKQPFEVTYIASTEVQSNDTIWAYYKSMRIDSPWFRRYVNWVKKKERIQDTPKGMEKWKYQETTREIENGLIGIKFNSKNSNSAGLAGRTRIASFVDELCRFKQTESSMGAEEAYRVMENSLRTVRSASENRSLFGWLGFMGSISSPISIDDKGMELLYKAPEIDRMYAFHYPTWEFNPEEKREYYEEQYVKDPVGTERDFGAKPPLAANPLVIDPEKFEERCINLELEPTASLDVIPFIDKTGQRYHRARMIDCRLLRNANRFICFDAGQTFDSFAGACGHLEIKQLDGKNIEYITVVDWMLKVLPSEESEVWFDSCVDLVEFQQKYQRIARVEFDRWNSVTLIQNIRNLGVHSEQLSLKPEDFIKFVADAQMGRIQLLPKDEHDDKLEPPFKSAAATGLYELSKLERSIDDKKIYNPQKGKRRGYNSDDVARVLVHLHKMCQDSQVMPTGAKMRSREARLKREEIGGQQYSMGNSGTVINTNRVAGNMSKRRW